MNADERYEQVRSLEGEEIRRAFVEISRDSKAQRSLLSIWSRPLSSVFLARRLLGLLMRHAVRNVRNSHDLHGLIHKAVQRFLMKRIDSFEVQGIEHIRSESGNCLFISNHRDIMLDSLLLNLSLYQSGGRCARVAVGDNLWSLPGWGVQFMRAVGCFTVHRVGESSRSLYLSYQKLSGYIQHLLKEQGHNVWLAQQPGRSRDGFDNTDPAVLKMLHLASRRSQDFADCMQSLRIAPTAISYEYDPCAGVKAERQLAEKEGREWQSNYTAEVEAGLVGHKGRVQLTVGEPITVSAKTPEELAVLLDQAICGNYRLWPSNFAAARRMGVLARLACRWSDEELDRAEDYIAKQARAVSSDDAREYLWNAYANPVRAAMQLQESAA